MTPTTTSATTPAEPAGAVRKAVTDTNTLVRSHEWRKLKKTLTPWLGEGGHVLLHGRVLAEMSRVARHAGPSGDGGPRWARARDLLDRPQVLLGLPTRWCGPTPEDVAWLCIDSADPQVIRRVAKNVVPGDADFEIAHAVRARCEAGEDVALVTADRDLLGCAERLGVRLMSGDAVLGSSSSPLVVSPTLPEPDANRVVTLLSTQSVRLHLEGLGPDLPLKRGEFVVVLSSTLAHAASGVALQRANDAASVHAARARVESLLRGEEIVPGVACAVLPTPRKVYHRAARSLVDDKLGIDAVGGGALDMHTLLVLSAAEVFGRAGHRVRVVSGHPRGDVATDLVWQNLRGWRRADQLKSLDSAVVLDPRSGDYVEQALPTDELDLDGLFRLYRRNDRGR